MSTLSVSKVKGLLTVGAGLAAADLVGVFWEPGFLLPLWTQGLVGLGVWFGFRAGRVR